MLPDLQQLISGVPFFVCLSSCSLLPLFSNSYLQAVLECTPFQLPHVFFSHSHVHACSVHIAQLLVNLIRNLYPLDACVLRVCMHAPACMCFVCIGGCCITP